MTYLLCVVLIYLFYHFPISIFFGLDIKKKEESGTLAVGCDADEARA